MIKYFCDVCEKEMSVPENASIDGYVLLKVKNGPDAREYMNLCDDCKTFLREWIVGRKRAEPVQSLKQLYVNVVPTPSTFSAANSKTTIEDFKPFE
ncbi:MAG: hypothetical protein IJ188_03025 [Clostridia bacterium]|nr:hypothetical protein [Clostridia bacterium]